MLVGGTAHPGCSMAVQGGDFTHGNGMGGESIYGAKFAVRLGGAGQSGSPPRAASGEAPGFATDTIHDF